MQRTKNRQTNSQNSDRRNDAHRQIKMFYHPDNHYQTGGYQIRTQRLVDRALNGEIFLFIEGLVEFVNSDVSSKQVDMNGVKWKGQSKYIYGVEAARNLGNWLASLKMHLSVNHKDEDVLEKMTHGLEILLLVVAIMSSGTYDKEKHSHKKWFKDLVRLTQTDGIKTNDWLSFNESILSTLKQIGGYPVGVPYSFVKETFEVNIDFVVEDKERADEILTNILYPFREREWARNIRWADAKYNDSGLECHLIVGSGHLFPLVNPIDDETLTLSAKGRRSIESMYRNIKEKRLTELLPGTIVAVTAGGDKKTTRRKRKN